MLPEIKLQGDVDVAALSPLLRGMLLSVAYADGEGGIGLTATGAMRREVTLSPPTSDQSELRLSSVCF